MASLCLSCSYLLSWSLRRGVGGRQWSVQAGATSGSPGCHCRWLLFAVLLHFFMTLKLLWCKPNSKQLRQEECLLNQETQGRAESPDHPPWERQGCCWSPCHRNQELQCWLNASCLSRLFLYSRWLRTFSLPMAFLSHQQFTELIFTDRERLTLLGVIGKNSTEGLWLAWLL